MTSLSRDNLAAIEQLIAGRLAEWPKQWEGFHWPGYTWEHTYRVRNLALALGKKEGADPAVVEPAALLHDIAKAEGKGHAGIGAEQADVILRDLGTEEGLRRRIVEAIALHSGDNTPDHPIENRVLGDADLIDANFGYVATWRFITIRAGHGTALGETVAAMADWLPRKDELRALLLTEAGRAVAAERCRAMAQWCAEIAAAFDGAADQHLALRRVVEQIAAEYERARLGEQLPRLAELAGDDEEAREACERLRAEADGEL